jgi:hypothetical protein
VAMGAHVGRVKVTAELGELQRWCTYDYHGVLSERVLQSGLTDRPDLYRGRKVIPLWTLVGECGETRTMLQ